MIPNSTGQVYLLLVLLLPIEKQAAPLKRLYIQLILEFWGSRTCPRGIFGCFQLSPGVHQHFTEALEGFSLAVSFYFAQKTFFSSRRCPLLRFRSHDNSKIGNMIVASSMARKIRMYVTVKK